MDIKFIKYDKRYSRNFYELNIEWLEKYFDVEDYDRSVLGNPEEFIINKGGVILFAKLENDIVGTVALMPTKEKKVCELSKMAVMPKFRNKKIGQKILNEIICISKQMKLNKLILYSNRKLKNNVTAGVVEPALSKLKSIQMATEAAITILRIDDFVITN